MRGQLLLLNTTSLSLSPPPAAALHGLAVAAQSGKLSLSLFSDIQKIPDNFETIYSYISANFFNTNSRHRARNSDSSL